MQKIWDTLSKPPELKDKKELQDEKGTIENAEEDAVVHTPPDPLWPSGILSIVVHQIVGLELANVKGSNGKRKGREYEPARLDAGDVKEEEGSKLPSSYCTILVLPRRTRQPGKAVLWRDNLLVEALSAELTRCFVMLHAVCHYGVQLHVPAEVAGQVA